MILQKNTMLYFDSFCQKKYICDIIVKRPWRSYPYISKYASAFTIFSVQIGWGRAGYGILSESHKL